MSNLPPGVTPAMIDRQAGGTEEDERAARRLDDRAEYCDHDRCAHGFWVGECDEAWSAHLDGCVAESCEHIVDCEEPLPASECAECIDRELERMEEEREEDKYASQIDALEDGWY